MQRLGVHGHILGAVQSLYDGSLPQLAYPEVCNAEPAWLLVLCRKQSRWGLQGPCGLQVTYWMTALATPFLYSTGNTLMNASCCLFLTQYVHKLFVCIVCIQQA